MYLYQNKLLSYNASTFGMSVQMKASLFACTMTAKRLPPLTAVVTSTRCLMVSNALLLAAKTKFRPVMKILITFVVIQMRAIPVSAMAPRKREKVTT